MKLHSPRFEKLLRRGVKKAVRQSRELKREYRNARRAGRARSRLGWFFQLVWAGLLGVVVWAVASSTRHPGAALAVINIWSVAVTAWTVQGLVRTLYLSPDIRALLVLPVSNETIFRWEMQKVFRASWFTLINFIGGFVGLGLFLNLSPGQWAGSVAVAVLSWAMLLALVLVCAARIPRLPYPAITSGIYMFGLLIFFTRKLIGPQVLALLDRASPVLNLVLPTGWAPTLFQLVLPGRNWAMGLYLIPIGLAIWTVRDSLAVLRSRYNFKEPVIPVTPDIIPAEEAPEPADPDGTPVTPAAPAQAGITAIEEMILSRKCFQPEQWQARGWFERRLWQWLDPRERVLAEFNFPKGISIAKPWWLILRVLAVGVGLGFAISAVNVIFGYWAFSIGIFMSFCLVLAQVLNSGVSFRMLFNNGVNMPLYAVYPVAFRELSRLLFKCSVIQLPLLVPFAMACAMLIAHLTGNPAGMGVVIGFKAGFLILAGRFIALVLAFSSGTNDSTRFRLRTFALVILFIGGGGLFLLLGGAGLFVPDRGIAWLLWFFALLDAYALHSVYGWFYHANRFDLMNVPKR